MAEISEQPTNIRSWKRIMRQVNPSVAVSIVESGKKRKQSTCMASLPDFPCRRLQAKGTQYSSKLMVEAGNLVIEKELGDLIRAKDPTAVFIAETWMDEASLKKMEVMVVIKALRFALNLGISSIVLEGDSKITIIALLNEDPSFTDYDHLVDEAKVLAKEFLEIDFSHVMRQSNSATHNNAGHARCVSELTVWMEDVPPHLSVVIQADSTIS